ncbi:MAG: 4Fe-4S dicluster domain-containing protein [Candidatus Freyarchaeota archaeon]
MKEEMYKFNRLLMIVYLGCSFLKIRVNLSRCVGVQRCGVCLKACPVGCFAPDEAGIKIRVVNEDACMECYACKIQCRHNAIELDF